MPGRLIRVGRVAGAFGVRGEVRISTYTENASALLTYRDLLRADGSAALSLLSGREHKGGLVARVREIATPEEADALRGLDLYIPRDRLPPPDEDEFYLTDLIGLSAISPAGKSLGVVIGVRDFGAGDVLEVKPADGASWFVAFTRETAPEVAVSEGRIVIARPRETSEREL